MTKFILVTVGPMAAEAIRAACFGVRRNNAPKAVTPDNAPDFNEFRNPMASQQALAKSKRLSAPMSGRPLSVEIELDGTEVTRVEEYTTPGQRIYEAVLGVDDLGPSQNEMDKVKALNGHYETEFFQEMSSFRGNFNMAKFKLDMQNESKQQQISELQQYIKVRGMPKELDPAERKRLQIAALEVVDYCEDLLRDYLPVSQMPKKFMKQVDEIQRRKACGTTMKWYSLSASTEDVRPELIADVKALQALAAEFLEGGEFYSEDAAAYDLTRVQSSHNLWKMMNPFKKATK